MANEEIKAEVEEALVALGKVHPRLPGLITALATTDDNQIKAMTLFERRISALDARLTRNEELGGVAIQKLERERKRRVKREIKEEKRLAKGIEKAGKQ